MFLFTSNRLKVRKLNHSDISAFHDMQSNPKVMQYIKATMSLAQSKNELDRFIEYYDNTDLFFNIWGITEKESQEIIGLCGVYENEKSEFEIAYRLREKYWKKGYGREISKALINYCFDSLDLPVIHAYAHVKNKGSIAILESEMTFVKEFSSKKTNFKERKYILNKEDWTMI